jgi:hypothetical protein
VSLSSLLCNLLSKLFLYCENPIKLPFLIPNSLVKNPEVQFAGPLAAYHLAKRAIDPAPLPASLAIIDPRVLSLLFQTDFLEFGYFLYFLPL